MRPIEKTYPLIHRFTVRESGESVREGKRDGEGCGFETEMRSGLNVCWLSFFKRIRLKQRFRTD